MKIGSYIILEKRKLVHIHINEYEPKHEKKENTEIRKNLMNLNAST